MVGVYETINRGRSWTKTRELGKSYKEMGIDPNDPNSFNKGWYYEQKGIRLCELAVDPTNDQVWYVGAGDFWNVKKNHRSVDEPHGVFFQYAAYGYLLKTTDAGKTWTQIKRDCQKIQM